MAKVKMKDDDAKGIERWLKSVHYSKMLIRVKHYGVEALSQQEKIIIAQLARMVDAHDSRLSTYLNQFYRAVVEHKYKMPASPENT